MFSTLAAIFKYSLLTLTILILSHIIEIQGVSLSQHVLHGMHAIYGYSPLKQADSIKADFIKTMSKHKEDLNKLDAEVSPDDQKALNRVIQHAEKK